MTERFGLNLKIHRVCRYQGDDPSWTNKPNKIRVVKYYEIALFLKDGGHTFINNEKYSITAGSIRFLRPGDKTISGFFPQCLLLSFEANDFSLSEEAFIHIPRFFQSSDMEKDAAILTDLIKAYGTQDNFECSICLWALMKQVKEASNMLKHTKTTSVMHQIRDYINMNYSAHLTLDDLATKFHMNPDHLQRKFKKRFNQSPAEYQTEIRIAQSIAFLTTTDLSIESIAEACGFSNSSHFIRAFKYRKNTTPAQYRRNYFSTINFS